MKKERKYFLENFEKQNDNMIVKTSDKEVVPIIVEDCNTCRKDKKTGKKTCKTCGRQKGEKRSKYPSCRPKPSDCGSSGKGKEWGKKSAKKESLQLENDLLEYFMEVLKNEI